MCQFNCISFGQGSVFYEVYAVHCSRLYLWLLKHFTPRIILFSVCVNKVYACSGVSPYKGPIFLNLFGEGRGGGGALQLKEAAGGF